MKLPRLTIVFLGVLLAVLPLTANATNSWSSYHWERTTTQVELSLGDNVSSEWKDYLGRASSDWNVSTVVETTVDPGRATNTIDCSPATGNVEVCSYDYGNNGWLGLAGIWVTRGKDKHITRGYVKLNDYYFNQSPYDTDDWKQLVTCQEVGHEFGLAHQDENFNNANIGSCMDYTSVPAGNTGPNQHDYDQLDEIYAHDHNGGGGDGGGRGNNGNGGGRGRPSETGLGNSEWGRAVHSDPDGRPDVFELDLPDGSKLITHVTWAR